MAKMVTKIFFSKTQEESDMIMNELMKETAEEKEEREKINIEIEELSKAIDAKKLLEKKKNVTISVIDERNIQSLELSIKNGEFASDTTYGSCNTELFHLGHIYLSRLSEEFDENTDNKIKFDNDFKVAVDITPSIKINDFKDAEIKRLNEIKNLILKCSGSSEFYRSFNLYFVMCSYLEFLQQPAQVNVAENKTLTTTIKDNHQTRLKMIHNHLKSNGYIDCPEDDFLYWFGVMELKDMKGRKKPSKIHWLKADSVLKNLIHQMCGTSGEDYIKIAFIFKNRYVSSNYKDYMGKSLFNKIKKYLYEPITKI